MWEDLLKENSDQVLLSFHTHWIGSFALLQQISSHIPYMSWSLYPESSSLDAEDWRVRLQLELPWTTVHVRITPEGCTLAEKIDGIHVCVCVCVCVCVFCV